LSRHLVLDPVVLVSDPVVLVSVTSLFHLHHLARISRPGATLG
jgi:hypothetical protein